MKTKINALVVDDSMEFTSSVEKYFKDNVSIDIVNVISDGSEVINYLQNGNENIDIILLDLILPGKDGLEILEDLKEQKINKPVIVLSSYQKDYAVRMTKDCRVDYFMIKPVNLPTLERRIKSIVSAEKSPVKELNVTEENELEVTELLHYLGVPSQLKGYAYLREGILMLYKSAGVTSGITKQIYPAIANLYNTTPSRVERAIRHAIEISWNRADYEMMNKIFGHSIDYDRAKPTNSEFMMTLSDALRLKQIVFS